MTLADACQNGLMDSTDTYGVVLAGGSSSRMGFDKASIDIGGVTLIERAVSALAEVVDIVVVAGGSVAPDGVEVIQDVHPGRGPLSGLDAAYEIANGRSIFLLGVDMPFVDATAIRKIIGSEIDAGGARLPIADGRVQPLCALYGFDLGRLVRRHIESDDPSMARLVGSIGDVAYIDMDDGLFDNVNTESDLAAALKRFGSPRSRR